MESYEFEEFSHFFVVDESSSTGLRWKESPSRNVTAGREAGGRLRSGHYRVKFGGKSHKVHRIVWLLTHRNWPEKIIDHIDGNPGNNKIENLREVTAQENQRNMRWAKGYCWHGGHKKWMASIRDGERQLFLGYFEREIDARVAYLKAKVMKHGNIPNHYREQLSLEVKNGLS